MVGYAFMGRAHSQAWRTAAHMFDVPLRPVLRAICGRDATRVVAAAEQLGWETYETDWRRLIDRDDIDLIDICTPGDSHAAIAIAALDTGKHVLCEKPLANTVAEAEAMVAAADRAAARGVRAMVGFNYRRVPALTLARQLVRDGRLGEIRHIRARYLQDWLVDPDFPLLWRLKAEHAGSGALGDLGAHIVDLVQFVTGDVITGVSALTETFVRRRPLPEGTGFGEVTVDDCVLFLGRMRSGAVASFEATRFATGRRNALQLEINGSAGSLAFDLESMNELHFYDHTEAAGGAGFRRILVTEREHPYLEGWWPPGHVLGYEHTFTHQAVDLLRAIGEQRDPVPSFADGLQVQRVLHAVEESAKHQCRWQPVEVG